MSRLTKSFFVLGMVIIFFIDIYYIVDAFLFHTYNEAIKFTIVLVSPLLLFLLFFFLANYDPIYKIKINGIFLFCSIVSFGVLLVYRIFYVLLIINNFNLKLAIVLRLSFIIFMILAFIKNFITIKSFGYYLFSLLLLLFWVQFIFIFITSAFIFNFNITNPDRYEFVKFHYFSPEEVSSLPKKIPDDATNIKFYFCEEIPNFSSRKLKLEFDSNTIKDNNHHARFYVCPDDEEEGILEE